MRLSTMTGILLSLSASAFAQEALRPDRPVAFTGAMLLDGYEAEPIHRATILFEGNRIAVVGEMDTVDIPANAVRIDLGGKTVMPGLIDAHVHVDLIGHGDYDRYYEFLGGTERLHEVMPIAAKQMLRAGVTSAIDLGTPAANPTVPRTYSCRRDTGTAPHGIRPLDYAYLSRRRT